MQSTPFETVHHDVDVCVVGGGMAGICAAIASARNGASTLLIHDRPVLGGNASSEIRMWICGAHGKHRKETGLLEEIQLENCYRNPTANYSIWDSVLYEKTAFCPNLTTLLNCSCNSGRMEEGRLVSIDAWQLTTQTWHRVEANLFIDCSGDSILAPITSAATRWGRESRDEFQEDIAPHRADRRTMGNTLLLQLRETDQPQPFIPPHWAYHFDDTSSLPDRLGHGTGHNFWWLELGGLDDTIQDAERIGQELMRIGYGVWHYMKNRWADRQKLENWQLDWKGALPGKRENRRYIGPHTLTQHDVRAGGIFDDLVAYGGWSMDDHHPAGLLYPGPATIFHQAPSPYGIPYRCLFSRDVPNLMCAGRNISATHVALSSTRVMATCALLGQAAGTAAALAVQAGVMPADLYPARITTLQERLMMDDCWLPGFRRPVGPLTRELRFHQTEAEILRDGCDRPDGEGDHSLTLRMGEALMMRLPQAREVGALRLVLDSNLNDMKRMPCRYPLSGGGLRVPGSMIRRFRVEGQGTNGVWETLFRTACHYQRLGWVPVQRTVVALRFIPEETWGAEAARVMSVDLQREPCPAHTDPSVVFPSTSWRDVIARTHPNDLLPPDSECEKEARGEKGAKRAHVGA